MLKIVLIMLLGVVVGRCLRRFRLCWLPRVTTLLVWALLFLLGIEVGSDSRVVSGIGTLGLEALLLSAGGIAGSIFLSWLMWRKVCKGRRQRP